MATDSIAKRDSTIIMFNTKAVLTVWCGALAMTVSLAAHAATPVSAEEAHRRAAALLKQMTIDEKVGQMTQSSGIVMPGLTSQSLFPKAAAAAGISWTALVERFVQLTKLS